MKNSYSFLQDDWQTKLDKSVAAKKLSADIKASTSSKVSSEDLAAVGATALQTANATSSGQAVVGGVLTGLSAASLAPAAAAGPIGLAVGAGAALMGMASSRRQKKAAQRAEEKRQFELKKAEELALAERQHARQQKAVEMLMGAFR